MLTSVWAKSAQVMIPNGTSAHTSVRAGLRLPAAEIKPAEIKSFNYRIFIGPKHNPLLRKMEKSWGDGWGDVMQYGWFWFVSRPLNFLLNTYHSWLDGIAKNWSWGLAIILLTITVRFIIWPLHAKSTHTMKRMAKLKPEMDKLKEKYPDDPNKLNTEMMGLYRKFGINPLGGCLPMFIQIPIFFGFYRMLQYAVELRGQGFLWVDDLSQPDTLMHIAGMPINILPVVMAISSFLQIKMTPDDRRQDAAAHHHVHAVHVLLLLLQLRLRPGALLDDAEHLLHRPDLADEQGPGTRTQARQRCRKILGPAHGRTPGGAPKSPPGGDHHGRRACAT